MIKVKYNFVKILTLLLIILFLLVSNTFKNISNIFNNNFDRRIENVYGFCGDESIGYLKFIKEKYNLNKNPKIINYIHTPNVSWSIINPKYIGSNSKHLILLNYPGYTLRVRYTDLSKNTFEIKNLYFYKDKINSINNIIFHFKERTDNDFSLELFSFSKLRKKKLIQEVLKGRKISEKEYKFYVNLKINEIDPNTNNLVFKIQNLNGVEVTKVTIEAENKININDFELIDQYEKCFLLR